MSGKMIRILAGTFEKGIRRGGIGETDAAFIF
jgi:hypothetical protein